MRVLLFSLVLLTVGCQAFGNLTTDTMVGTNRVTGNPPVGPAAH